MNPRQPDPPRTNRRAFLHSSSALAASVVAAPFLSFPRRTFAVNSETLKVGLVGCGGRGTGAASQALSADPNVVLHAMGDVFEDRLRKSFESVRREHPERTMVTPDTSFIGFDAIDKVIASGVNVVILATPPGFRPYHIRKCVEAGKHVFTEKPMAVDAAGVRLVMDAVAQARARGLALVSGFCWRYNYGERELMKRLHDGQIGELVALQNNFDTGYLWVNPRQPEWNDMTYQLRNWYYFTWLSGDHLVEQAVHSLDKMSWAMNDVPPEKCVAHAGRQVRTAEQYGHIFDHFSVVYHYPNGARGYHFSRQQENCAVANADCIMGTRGTAQISAFGPLTITGEKPWRFTGERPNMYQVEHNEMYASIRKGEPMNDGRWMAQSTLIAIMGRMAAYTGQEVTWEQALNSREDLAKWVTRQEDAPGDPRFAWDMSLRTPLVAMPGQTKLV